MRLLRILTAVALAATLAGCWVLSIEPLYTSDDLVFEPSLIGIWGGDADTDDETWTFTSEDSSAYLLVTTETGEHDARFDAHLLRLGGRLMMDLLPQEPDEVNEFQLGHLIPGHSFWTVSLVGDSLVLDVLDVQRVRNFIDSTGVKISHIEKDDVVVLTASTAELQEFIGTNIDELLSGDPVTMKRIK